MTGRRVQEKRLDWADIHNDASFRSYAPVLAPLSLIYRVGVYLRLKAYEKRWMRVRTLPGFVVSVGNLTVGGTGKTPAVITLADWALRQGYRTAILSRGYGGHRQKTPMIVSEASDARVTGDEPYLLAKALPDVPVVVFRERYRAGLYAKERFDTEIFLLDDGFQHIELKRDINVVLMDATNPFGNGHLLPWGPLREPVNELRRGDALVFTRYEEGPSARRSAAWVGHRFPGIPQFHATHRPREVVFTDGSGTASPESLSATRVAAFAGIARPDGFRQTLENMGVHVAAFRKFNDHHRYTREDMASLAKMKRDSDAALLVTTEKDWVRLTEMAPKGLDIAYLTVDFCFSPNGDAFFQMIKDVLET